MSTYLIDTDWIIDHLRGNVTATQLFTDLAAGGLAISVISYGELYQGVHYARDPERSSRVLRAFLQDKEMLHLTPEIMERFAIIRGQLSRHNYRQIGDMDLLIAATAVHHDLILLTRNRRDFQLVPGLRLFAEL